MKLRVVLGDQLSHDISSLRHLAADDVVLMCEVMEEATYVKHHKKKIAYIFSAMRHFAEELENKGVNVKYTKLNSASNTGSFEGEILKAIRELSPDEVIITEPGEWRVLDKLKKIGRDTNIPVTIVDDERFLCSRAEFAKWAKDKKQLRMEFFYREMRKKFKILLEENGDPVGGKWNYDQENRKAAPKGMKFPARISHEKDYITKEVIELVEKRFSSHFGDIEPFYLAVTRDDAEKEMATFISRFLPCFGDYQDAMVTDESYLYHSRISAYINIGLLDPLDICRKAEEAYRKNKAPLNAVEGFIRQIIGWREYVRGIYWLKMPEYSKNNFFKAERKLPNFYWTGDTKMHCIKQAVCQTKKNAYSHHIQRLMVTGNFALIAGLLPEEVCEWYLLVYADAYEWVELPNTLGMALYGDGGFLASKPYAASGKYINKMSDYCSSCEYDPNVNTGSKACPFNYLYWDFMVRNREKLKNNQRMPYVYSTWDKMDQARKNTILADAKNFLDNLK